MLRLHNIGKTYKTKAKNETVALKDVNLEIADRGMVFILGKSGSGKSTLLNLLGGLDAPTSGEILVDGVSMNQFSQRDYDAYRNNYVGFIFQEFNLLGDFNVRDNVALALRLAKVGNVDANVSDALKQVELTDDFLTRRIDEMSGGEKQRVAIARAIVKDSKLILADEPTGNLDSATGETIWNILKNLSRERLVVVVSHDRESAEKYADRIIEISDGQVIADNGVEHEQSIQSVSQTTFTANGKSLPFASRLKMGYNTLRLRKAKTVSVILLAIFSILAILLTQMCLSFSSELTLAKYMEQNDIEYFTVEQGYISGYDNMFRTDADKPFRKITLDYIANNSNYIKDRSYIAGIVNSKQDVLDFGLSFVGEALELDDDSYYVTLKRLEDCYNASLGVVEVDGEFVELIEEQHPIEFLIGKRVDFNQHWVPYLEELDGGILAGVIDTKNLVNVSALPQYFCNSNFDGVENYGYPTLNDGDPKEVKLQIASNLYDGELNICPSSSILNPNSVLLTSDGIKTWYSKFELTDNEIVLSYEMYDAIFDAQPRSSYISSDLSEVRSMPTEIGQSFDFKFYEYETGDLIVDYGKVKLVGIAFSAAEYQGNKATSIAVGKQLASLISTDLTRQRIVIQTSSIKNLNAFVRTLRNKHLCYIQNVGSVDAVSFTGQSGLTVDITEMAYEFETIIKLLSIVFLAIAVILVIVLVLLVINLISFSIANRKKEVGILSALGVSNGDITSVFLLETLIISSISFVFIITLVLLFEFVFNRILSRAYLLGFVFPFLRVDIVTIAVAIGAAFGLLLLAALIPIRKIIKLKPIDAIRNI